MLTVQLNVSKTGESFVPLKEEELTVSYLDKFLGKVFQWIYPDVDMERGKFQIKTVNVVNLELPML